MKWVFPGPKKRVTRGPGVLTYVQVAELYVTKQDSESTDDIFQKFCFHPNICSEYVSTYGGVRVCKAEDMKLSTRVLHIQTALTYTCHYYVNFPPWQKWDQKLPSFSNGARGKCAISTRWVRGSLTKCY